MPDNYSGMKRLQNGAALMALIVVLCIGGLIAQSWFESRSKSQALRQQTELVGILELKHVKSSLLAHAILKGLNSLTHPGNLPCPSSTSAGTTPANCQDAWLGHLPIESRSAVNHLRLAVNAKPNQKALSLEKSWRYAVSPQLIQTNALGWSQWVDWSQPSLVVWHGDQSTTEVVAVVAEEIEPLGGHAVRVSGTHMLIRMSELQFAIAQSQKALAHSTFYAWMPGGVHQGAEIFSHENLSWNPATGEAQPKWSDCQCSCTRTRCNCSCAEDSWWTSAAACLIESDTCKAAEKWAPESLPKGKALTYLCNTKAGEFCAFKGSARLLSAWPVSSTLPVAAKGRACENFSTGSCPLSTSNSPCACEFNWPSNIKGQLASLPIKIDTIPQTNQPEVEEKGHGIH